jgi:magnesium transporter
VVEAESPKSESITADELAELWAILDPEEQVEGFGQLERGAAESFFLTRSAGSQATLLLGMPPDERRGWVRLLAPDDAADVLQHVSEAARAELLELLDDATRHEVQALLAYAEDEAGGVMNPRYARMRPDMRVDEALRYLRRQARERSQTVYYAYVVGPDERLLGVLSFKELLLASDERTVADVMRKDIVTVPAHLDQEQIARVIARHDLLAVPVVDAEGRMRGIVTVDDVVDVLDEEATEDIQKLGGMEALGLPYWRTAFPTLVRKRAGWLIVLFLGEMLTATAMTRYEEEIARAVVLALFVPLIISSGGNSGSQASTLIVRAMALGEVRLRHVLRVMRRELASGVVLGSVLAAIGFLRILAWQRVFGSYGEHAGLVAITVGLSLVGVVTWGTLAGSMLPFLLQRLGFDPASASAPFVATLVDVSGLVIYFSVAQIVLRGTLL